MLKDLQKIIIGLAVKAGNYEIGKKVRKAAIVSAATLRSGKSLKSLASIGKIAALHERETSSWVTYGKACVGEVGPFDACDLQHWVRLAELSGVDCVPAEEILRLTADEVSVASGSINLDINQPSVRRAIDGAVNAAEEIKRASDAGTVTEEHQNASDGLNIVLGGASASKEEVDEKLSSAMDEIPEGWMVRNTRIGSSNLKALAGAGVIGGEIPEVRFGPDVEVGPGWVRVGNRRKLDIHDERTIEAIASGPSSGTVFLARPWVKASRHNVVDDPHREDTPLKGAGVWPAEWRAFIEDGVVVGVSYYYSWSGQASPYDALVSLQVREQAQKIIDTAVEMGMYPRFVDLEFLRSNKSKQVQENDSIQNMLNLFGREKVACTLDFIETDEGLKFLEGGPANTPIGGGHPCGFAGNGGRPGGGRKTDTHGVALKNMPHVIPGDPKTWESGDRSGAIFTWEEIEELATELDHGNSQTNNRAM